MADTTKTTTSSTRSGSTAASTSTRSTGTRSTGTTRSTSTRAASTPAAKTARRATTAKRSRTRAANATSSAVAAQKTAAKTTAAEGRSYAERVLLTSTGAVLVARDTVTETVDGLVKRYGSVGAAQKELDKAQRTLTRDLKKYERRGATARNRFEREVRKTRTRLERELRQRRCRRAGRQDQHQARRARGQGPARRRREARQHCHRRRRWPDQGDGRAGQDARLATTHFPRRALLGEGAGPGRGRSAHLIPRGQMQHPLLPQPSSRPQGRLVGFKNPVRRRSATLTAAGIPLDIAWRHAPAPAAAYAVPTHHPTNASRAGGRRNRPCSAARRRTGRAAAQRQGIGSPHGEGPSGSRPTPSRRAARAHPGGRSSTAAGGGVVSRRNCSMAPTTAAASSGEAEWPNSVSLGRRFMFSTVP